MGTSHVNWYDFPRFYDIAFGWDPSVEVDFLETCFQNSTSRRVQRVYEPFVGTGRIAIELARRGFDVVGADINERAIAYARDVAARSPSDRTPEFHVADVTRFSPDAPVDAVVTLIDSFRYLLNDDDLTSALDAFRRCLHPQGIVIVGLSVGDPTIEAEDESTWTIERDGTAVEVHVCDLRKPGDIPGTSIMRTQMHITEPDGSTREIVTDAPMRRWNQSDLDDVMAERMQLSRRCLVDLQLCFEDPICDEAPNGNVVAVYAPLDDGKSRRVARSEPRP